MISGTAPTAITPLSREYLVHFRQLRPNHAFTPFSVQVMLEVAKRMGQRRIGAKEIEAILKLDGPARYDHFIKHVVDCEQAWGLYRDGWVMGEDDSGIPTLPRWPAKEYASLNADGDWADCEPAEIPLDDLVDELLPKLKNAGILPSVFRTPEGQSTTPNVDQLLEDLRNEMRRYE